MITILGFVRRGGRVFATRCRRRPDKTDPDCRWREGAAPGPTGRVEKIASHPARRS